MFKTGLIHSRNYYYFSNRLLLDDIPNAAAAYSLWKLRTDYSGNCLRVRRSTDNVETDIGFANGYIDTAAITAFKGAANLFLTTWYDQSGNGRNATQTSAANQFTLVHLGGGIYQVNGNSSLCFMSENSVKGYTEITTYSVVSLWDNAAQVRHIIGSSNPAANNSFSASISAPTNTKSEAVSNTGQLLNAVATGVNFNTYLLHVSRFHAGEIFTKLNNTASGTANVVGWTGFAADNNWKIGHLNALYFKEIIVYPAFQDITTRDLVMNNINQRYAIY